MAETRAPIPANLDNISGRQGPVDEGSDLKIEVNRPEDGVGEILYLVLIAIFKKTETSAGFWFNCFILFELLFRLDRLDDKRSVILFNIFLICFGTLDYNIIKSLHYPYPINKPVDYSVLIIRRNIGLLVCYHHIHVNDLVLNTVGGLIIVHIVLLIILPVVGNSLLMFGMTLLKNIGLIIIEIFLTPEERLIIRTPLAIASVVCFFMHWKNLGATALEPNIRPLTSKINDVRMILMQTGIILDWCLKVMIFDLNAYNIQLLCMFSLEFIRSDDLIKGLDPKFNLNYLKSLTKKNLPLCILYARVSIINMATLTFQPIIYSFMHQVKIGNYYWFVFLLRFCITLYIDFLIIDNQIEYLLWYLCVITLSGYVIIGLLLRYNLVRRWDN